MRGCRNRRRRCAHLQRRSGCLSNTQGMRRDAGFAAGAGARHRHDGWRRVWRQGGYERSTSRGARLLSAETPRQGALLPRRQPADPPETARHGDGIHDCLRRNGQAHRHARTHPRGQRRLCFSRRAGAPTRLHARGGAL
ncbi:hypothetical protein SDC9_183808 [bioreactor metagenome]|uniref:Uncharacterized protein n=1 Tax=bioreactor metagenome TaxID=1076179 RepID=A0A645HDU4_9ZZZZ